jgi:hypothetical protein
MNLPEIEVMIRRAIVLTLGDIGLTADARRRWIFSGK